MAAESSPDTRHRTTSSDRQRHERARKRLDSVVDTSPTYGGRPSTDKASVDGTTLRSSSSTKRTARQFSSNERKQSSPSSAGQNSSSRSKREGVRRDSMSSSASSKARRPRISSNPSSRRAYTIQDFSRPGLPSRVRTSQTVPTGRDVDDVLALHFRSCTLFSNVPSPSNTKIQTTGSGNVDPSIHSVRSDKVSVATRAADNFAPTVITPQHDCSNDVEDSIAPVEIPTTVHYWTSPSTRKKEYEEIDRSNQGIRGLFRRMTPRWCPGNSAPRFYEKDMDDVGSVRRYRLDIESDDEDDADEKSTSTLHRNEKRPALSKRWSCF